MLVAEGVSEGDTGQRCTSTRIVDDFADHTFQVPISLAEIEGPETGRTLPVVGVRSEDRSSSLTLCSDHTTHWRMGIRVSGIGGEGKGMRGADDGVINRKRIRVFRREREEG